MFSTKLVVIAAGVALAMGHVTDAKLTKVNHHKAVHHKAVHHKTVVHKALHHKEANTTENDFVPYDGPYDGSVIEGNYCIEGWTPVSVEGVEQIYCTYGQPCSGDIQGSCPQPQYQLDYGAYCDKVKTGVLGCKPMTEEMWWQTQGGGDKGPVCGDGYSPMSVEGVEGVFCVQGQSCVADIDGVCPEAQDGLEYGAYCGVVKTGVLGCKPIVPYDGPYDGGVIEGSYCIEGWTPMSVEGVEGIFCTPGQACSGDIEGSCPEPQYGLDYGAYCDTVKTGVLGCKPMTEEMWWQTQGGEDSGPVCAEGSTPMSVEGVEGVFCVEGQACVADIDGACPGSQEGLEHGSYCGVVATGVKGCKPNASKHHKVKHSVKKPAHHKKH